MAGAETGKVAEEKIAVVNQEEVAVEPYEADKDIKMTITLYKKKRDGENYKIYIDGKINVTKPGEQVKNIVVTDDKRLVSDSTKGPEENTTMIKVITDLINETDAAPAEENTAVQVEDATEGSETEGELPTTESSGGYSSKSVSFRPFKKRRTAKKRRGRK